MSIKKAVIKQDEENPIHVDVMAQAIIDIDKAMDKISKSPLNRRAIVCLIQDQSGLPKTTINLVLNCLEELKKDFVKAKPK